MPVNFSIQRFLQLFIDHVSFYDVLFPTDVDAYELATRTLSKYSFEKKENLGSTSHSFHSIATKNLEHSVQAILSMRNISLQKDLTNEEKRERARNESKKLFDHLGTNIVKCKVLRLDKGEILTLSPDFCLICEIQQISPIEHLTNLMECTSIADMEARASLNMRIENPAIAFYMMVRHGYGNLYNNKVSNRMIFDYIDDLQELRLHLFIYRSLTYRIQKHKELLNKYYNLIS